MAFEVLETLCDDNGEQQPNCTLCTIRKASVHITRLNIDVCDYCAINFDNQARGSD